MSLEQIIQVDGGAHISSHAHCSAANSQQISGLSEVIHLRKVPWCTSALPRFFRIVGIAPINFWIRRDSLTTWPAVAEALGICDYTSGGTV